MNKIIRKLLVFFKNIFLNIKKQGYESRETFEYTPPIQHIQRTRKLETIPEIEDEIHMTLKEKINKIIYSF